MNKFNCKDSLPNTPESFKNTVRETLNSLPDYSYKENNMKISFKKRAIIALASVMVLGTTAFAVGKITSITGSTSRNAIYSSLPTENKVKSDFDFAPKLVDKFSNGYSFDNAYSSDVEGQDEDKNAVYKTKTLMFNYKNNKEQITLEMANRLLGERTSNDVAVDNYNNIDLYYTNEKYKFLPVDYEMTEQDKKDEASGKYIFSIGSQKVEVNEFKHLSWEQEGVYYSLYGMDTKLTKEELIKMAHEIIDSK